MLPKRQRIEKNFFAEVLKKGRRFFSMHFSVVFLKDKSCKFTKFAVVVSKKDAKKAFVRNRIRRRVYGAINMAIKDKNLEIGKGSMIIFVKKNIDDVDFKTLNKEILYIFDKVNFFIGIENKQVLA